MSSGYWVIREGKVRGQGRYWSIMHGWVDRMLATVLNSPDYGGKDCRIVRLVRVTRKPRVAQSDPIQDFLAVSGLVARTRTEALEEAERACVALLPFGSAGECAAAVSSLRSK